MCVEYAYLVLAVSSVSDGSSAKCSTILLKISKANHIKTVTFRKHFSCSLIKIYRLIFLFWHFDLFYFFAQFSTKKSVLKTLYHTFFHYITLLPTQNMESDNEKKIHDNNCWFWGLPARGNFPKLVEISNKKNKKIASFVSNFSAPNTIRSYQNWSILLLNVEFYELGWIKISVFEKF